MTRVGDCSEKDCAATTITARGMCRKHYVRWYRQRPDGKRCKVASCENASYSSGYCAKHHSHWKRYGDPEAADKRKAVQRKFDPNGYVLVRRYGHPAATGGGGWVLEHRVVMEEAIGRFLTSDESVHHKNGIRDDNRRSNLELWARYQPAGQRVEDLVAHARDVLALYGDLVV